MPVEIRMIVWNCRGVPSGDMLSDMSDLFVRSWMDGIVPQKTDVHWRAKKGKAAWNWRVKFNVNVPTKFTEIYLQLWDEDLLKNNDCLAEYTLDIGKMIMTQYIILCILLSHETA